jgi:hypothetical protein
MPRSPSETQRIGPTSSVPAACPSRTGSVRTSQLASPPSRPPAIAWSSGGSFTHVDGLVAPGVAVWDGARWAGLGTVRPPLRRIRDVEVFRGRIVVGGSPDDGAPPCAIWNGANWEPLGSLPAPTDAAIIEDLYVHEGRLLAGGRIPSGPGAADLVLRWDGESWSSLLSTARSNDAVRTLAEVGGQLHAGGNFEIEGDSSTLVGIARWDGTGWTGIPGLTSASHVDAIASFEGTSDRRWIPRLPGKTNPTHDIGPRPGTGRAGRSSPRGT